ncbi:MAG: hypothetical protein K0R00_2412 [Herbinix sp.]|nr:hypothetical protein [Herbinix sp.]
MRIKMFTGRMNQEGDKDFIEDEVNSFINGKKVIDIKQSISTEVNGDEAPYHFVVVTVMYV